MRANSTVTILVGLATIVFAAPLCEARDLSFEERVRAQEALERVYYAHQIGTTKPFEEAVQTDVLERGVELYLARSVALEELWNTEISSAALERELERMVRGTSMPGRLRELLAALEDDPVTILECLVRPVLADRLIRNFYAYDERLHVAARGEIETLRGQLVRGLLDPWSEYARRTLREFSRDDEPAPGEFERRLEEFSGAVGQVSGVQDERDRFVVSVVLDRGADSLRVAEYAVPKRSFDAWWREVEPAWRGASVATVASPSYAIGPRIEALRQQAEPLGSCAADDTWDNGILDQGPFPNSRPLAVWTGSLMVVWGGERYDPATDTWTPISTLDAEPPRVFGTVVWTGSEMIVWGGGYFGNEVDTGARYDPLSDSWTAVSTVGAPSARTEHTAVWTGSEMIVWGGLDGSPQVHDNGARYDPTTDSWTPMSTVDAPAGRRAHGATWTGEVMVVWGGVTTNGLENTGGRYDPATDSWTPTATTGAPSARRRHTTVWTGERMIVWGGDTQTTVTDTGGVYDPAADSWAPTPAAGAPSPRVDHTAVWTGDRMIVWGGSPEPPGSASMDTGAIYDPDIDAWIATTTGMNAPESRYSHTAFWTGDRMVVWGGTTEDPPASRALATGGRYDPFTDSWTPTSWTGAALPVAGHTAVWTGNLMILWGGAVTEGSPVNTGSRYDPATDSWAPTSQVGAPHKRWHHTAVWTGNRMIVWGGIDTPTELDTGALYDPLTDTWTPTSTSQAPLARSNHTAVWSGTHMVVWGGRPNYDTFTETGGRYDPATDSWQPTSLLGPVARADHTAVWTGSEMIVWGGQGWTELPRPGGRYDPVTDTWLGTTSIVGMPESRLNHTAVWTGTEMIVWGGEDDEDTAYMTGGRYDPVTNAWGATSTVDAPTGRMDHTAVWTGAEMIVWGGEDPGHVSVETGGRYDPQTNGWLPTTTVDAPAPRNLHTAVWTGSHMIVWGGAPPSYVGGRYALGLAVDDDGDGLSECDGDCSDVDPGAFAIPAEVSGLTFEADKQTLSWASAAPGAGSATLHDVIRGTAGEPASSASDCLDSDVAATTTVDSNVPGSGEGFWYLVRGRNICGPGPYGLQSDGVPRTGPPCP